MADDRYYESRLDEIPLDDILRSDQIDDVTLRYIETNSLTGSSYSGEDSTGGLAFTFNTKHEITKNELILNPEDVGLLSRIDSYYERFYKDESTRGLFIPDGLPRFQKCGLCGRSLKEYMDSEEEPYCNESDGYIWCFEYDRTLVFHGSCIREIVSVLKKQIEKEPERFVSSSI